MTQQNTIQAGERTHVDDLKGAGTVMEGIVALVFRSIEDRGYDLSETLGGQSCWEIAEESASAFPVTANAPELLQTLKWIVKYPDVLDDKRGFRKQIDALIAKAEGK